MLDGIEALIALERLGTVSEAASYLRLTQSAVSKRIHALQSELGFNLVEPDGRKLRLTSRGKSFLEKAKPLLSGLRSLAALKSDIDQRSLSIGIADSIASSWGPKLLRKAQERITGLELEIHVHRSLLVIENVRLGRYHLGLCTEPPGGKDLAVIKIAEEPMVVIARDSRSRGDGKAKMISIERDSATWQTLEGSIRRHPRLQAQEFVHVESFQAVIQMVRAGYGNGLVPLGIARAMHVPSKAIVELHPKVKRPIRLVSRASVASLESVRELTERLRIDCLAHFGASQTDL